MRDMEYLSEKDLEYFKKLEEKGEAVIVYIDPDRLLDLDVKEFLEKRERDPDMEEVRAWLDENKALIQEEYIKAQDIMRENERILQEMEATEEAAVSNVVEKLKTTQLAPTRYKLLQKAIQSGLSEKMVGTLLREDLSEEQLEAIMKTYEIINQ